MAEVGYASLGIIPSFDGFGSKLESGSAPAMLAAGKSGGSAFGEAAAKEGGSTFSSKIGSLLKAGAVGAGGVAALAFGVGLKGALENEALGDKLAAQLGVGDKRSAQLGRVAGSLYAGAWGDSMESVNGAIRSVVTNLDGFRDASKSRIKDVTATVLDLNSAFEEEPEAITRAASQMVRTGLAKSSKQALDIITRGFQTGADKSQDLLDTFNEYGTQFRKLGLNGKKATGLLTQGLQAGARDADVVADSLKEFAIRAVDGSDASQTAYEKLGLNANKMTSQIAKGGEDASEGLQSVLDRLRDMKDPVEREAAAVGLFGTQAEDLGAALFSLDPSKAEDALGRVGGAAERMGDTLNDNASSRIESFKRTMQTKLIDFVGNEVVPVIERDVLPKLEEFSDWFSKDGVPAIKDFIDDAKPLAEKVLPAIASALDTTKDAAKKIAPLLTAVFDGFNKLPDWVQSVIVLGAGAAALKAKLGGGRGGLTGGLLGGLSSLKPIPVVVTNPGFGATGLPGAGTKGAPVVPGAAAGPKPGIGPLAGLSLLAVAGTPNQLNPSDRGQAIFGDGWKPVTDEVIETGDQARKVFGEMVESGQYTTDELREFFHTMRIGFGDEFDYMTFKARRELNRQADLFSLLPTDVRTDLVLNGGPHNMREIKDLQRQYDLTPKEVKTLVKVYGVDEAKRQVEVALAPFMVGRTPAKESQGSDSMLPAPSDVPSRGRRTSRRSGGGVTVNQYVGTVNDSKQLNKDAAAKAQQAAMGGWG